MSDQDDDVSSVQPAQMDAGLAARFAERANLSMDQSELFRRKRGRTSDFCQRYGIGRVFAGKILAGTSECPLAVLKALASDLAVSTDFLLGLSDTPQPTATDSSFTARAEIPATSHSVKRLALFDVTKEGLVQAEGSFDLPQHCLPYGMWDSELIVVRWRARTAEAYIAFGGYLVIEVSAIPRDGAAHLVLWSGLRPEILQVASERGGETYSLVGYDDRSDSQDGAKVTFGLPSKDASGDADKDMLRMVGPVVGRVELSDQGIRIAATAKATGSRFVNLASP